MISYSLAGLQSRKVLMTIELDAYFAQCYGGALLASESSFCQLTLTFLSRVASLMVL